ncbi:MAG: helix-turn-helix transcriptional regulator [Dehalococcoidia bacterium]|nr:helix-turn-helix transcriptional regulator [Dehalococcoidia bacterium]
MATLRELRNRAFLTQEELAEKAKVSRSTIAVLESGRRTRGPRPRTIRRLARALGCEPADIEFDAR